MATITSDEAFAIARQLADLAQDVSEYRFGHAAELSAEDMAQWRNVEDRLRSISNRYLDLGANIVLDDAAGAIQQLSTVTARLKKTLTTLANIEKGLAIAGALLQLATAFGSANPGAIAGAVQNVLAAAAPA